jgi:hypothetical protein
MQTVEPRMLERRVSNQRQDLSSDQQMNYLLAWFVNWSDLQRVSTAEQSTGPSRAEHWAEHWAEHCTGKSRADHWAEQSTRQSRAEQSTGQSRALGRAEHWSEQSRAEHWAEQSRALGRAEQSTGQMLNIRKYYLSLQEDFVPVLAEKMANKWGAGDAL